MLQKGGCCQQPKRKIVQTSQPSPACYNPPQEKPYTTCICRVVPTQRKALPSICNQCKLPIPPPPPPPPSPPQIVIVGTEFFDSTGSFPYGYYRSMVTSLDGGTTWQPTLGDDIEDDFTANSYPSCVLYANGLWIAACQIGSGGSPANPNWRPMVSSTDGLNWSYLNTGPAFVSFALRIAYGNGRWIIAGGPTSTTALVTSTNGVNFTDITGATGLPAAGTVAYAGIHYANGRWVLGKTGADASGNCMYTSLDGLTWTACSGDTFSNGVCFDIYWNGSLWVAVGFEDSSPYPGAYTITTSSDGITWTRNTTATFTGFGSYTGSIGVRVTYGNGRWIAVGQDGRMLTSTDGVNWSVATTSGLTITDYLDVKWTGQQWILVGASAVPIVFTSPDGLNWTSKTIPGFTSTGNPQAFAIAVKV